MADVGEIMDKAAHADREALFAALQASVGVIVDMHYGRHTGVPYPALTAWLNRVDEALTVGAPYGSPEHLAHLEREQGSLPR